MFEFKGTPKNAAVTHPLRKRDHEGAMAWCEEAERTLNLGIDTTAGFSALPFTSYVTF